MSVNFGLSVEGKTQIEGLGAEGILGPKGEV
jgi:hypothetical protein